MRREAGVAARARRKFRQCGAPVFDPSGPPPNSALRQGVSRAGGRPRPGAVPSFGRNPIVDAFGSGQARRPAPAGASRIRCLVRPAPHRPRASPRAGSWPARCGSRRGRSAKALAARPGCAARPRPAPRAPYPVCAREFGGKQGRRRRRRARRARFGMPLGMPHPTLRFHVRPGHVWRVHLRPGQVRRATVAVRLALPHITPAWAPSAQPQRLPGRSVQRWTAGARPAEAPPDLEDGAARAMFTGGLGGGAPGAGRGSDPPGLRWPARGREVKKIAPSPPGGVDGGGGQRHIPRPQPPAALGRTLGPAVRPEAGIPRTGCRSGRDAPVCCAAVSHCRFWKGHVDGGSGPADKARVVRSDLSSCLSADACPAGDRRVPDDAVQRMLLDRPVRGLMLRIGWNLT